MKKVLAIILAIALLCIIAVGTTLSYFKDEAYNANTMTVGKVGISQTINGSATVSSSYALFPVTAEPDSTTGLVPVANNGVNLDVVVTVDSDSEDAYVRTIFAFELKANGASPIGTDVKLVGTGITMTNITFTKNGVQYIVGICDYGKVSKDATLSSLKQVYLDKTVGNEFSPAVNGAYDILVLSQAVQAQGFNSTDAAMTAAYGALTAENLATWFANR